MTVLLTLILGLIAAIHALWGRQIWVPIRDEEQLARTVVGAKGVLQFSDARQNKRFEPIEVVVLCVQGNTASGGIAKNAVAACGVQVLEIDTQ